VRKKLRTCFAAAWLVLFAAPGAPADVGAPSGGPRGTSDAAERTVKPRNIILMIGDGMGLAHISAARFHKGRLALEDMDHVGFSYTSSLENFVTDSSASATALASGYLILNGWVGLHPDGSPTKTVLEYAEEKGMWTGLVVTCRITHATPASMLAHVKSRGEEQKIAEQIAAADVECILGGGWDMFLPTRTIKIHEEMEVEPEPIFAAGPPRSRTHLISGSDLLGRRTIPIVERQLVGADGKAYGNRKDKKNLIEAMEKRGYRSVRSATELMVASSGPPQKLLGLFHSGAMPRANEGRSPSLSAMSLAALKHLSQSPRGFFLMIEGSQIDWGAHANDFDYAVTEAADFDDTVGVVRRFLEEAVIAEETLLVVTADHETGGLTLNVNSRSALALEPKWTTGYHTGIPVPVFTAGPGSREIAGIQSHVNIGRLLIERVVGQKVVFTYPRSERSPTAKADDSRAVGKK
jgi:alkaline phosphatase